jgi:ubiquitin-activating enzyme E1
MPASIHQRSCRIGTHYGRFLFTDRMKFMLISLRMSKLLETISKKPIPSHQKNIIFEITAEDQTEEDVEIPYVM